MVVGIILAETVRKIEIQAEYLPGLNLIQPWQLRGRSGVNVESGNESYRDRMALVSQDSSPLYGVSRQILSVEEPEADSANRSFSSPLHDLERMRRLFY